MPLAQIRWLSLTWPRPASPQELLLCMPVTKSTKNTLLFTATHFFVPVAIETFGPWNEEGLNFISELGRRTSLVTGDPREISYLFQRLSVEIQLGNAASCTSTFLIGPEEEEYSSPLAVPSMSLFS